MKTLPITETEEIEKVICTCDVCFVGMADIDGVPYVIPMSFGYREGVIYLHSAQEGRSISILEKNPRVCITFCSGSELVYQHPQVACSYSMSSKSVIAWGNVSYVENMDQKREILDIIMNQYTSSTFTYSDPAVRNVRVWKIEVEKMTCKEFGIRAGDK